MRKIVIIQIAVAALLFIAGVCVLLGGKPGTTDFQLKENPPTAAASQTTGTRDTTAPSETVTAPTGDTVAPTETEATQPETEPDPAFQMPEITWMTFPEGRQLSAAQAFVYDCQTRDFMFLQGAPEDTVWMASITKLFAIHVASQYLGPEENIRIESGPLSKVSYNSSTAGLEVGEVLTASQLYVASLISSGNDASYVLATAAGRKIEGDPSLSVDAAIEVFVAEMNRQAQTLGLTGTHFTNPDGYHDTEHYSCMQDLATIAELALSNEAVYSYGPLSRVTITPVSGSDKQWQNLNLLVDANSEYYCPYAVGLKTGYTGAAGNCLLSAFDIEGHRYIIGTFNCPSETSRFDDTLQLFNEIVIQQDAP